VGKVRRLTCLVLFALCTQLVLAADIQYSVKEGETLFSISRKAQVPVDVLCLFNGIADAAKVKAGTVVKVPTVYVIKKGDTLFGISRAFSVSIAKLLELNKLPKDASIKVGDKIYIPTSTAAPATDIAAANTPPTGKTSGTTTQQAFQGTTQITSLQTAGVVLPLTGRREPEKGKSGVVFYGAAGDVVHSATAGEVRWAATYWGSGKVIIIRSLDGTLFMYSGNRDLLVNVGDRVHPGDEIARLGETPQGGGVNLHLSITDKGGHVIDPEKYFSAKSES
jgi:lipoprotein YgeR